MPRSIRQIQEAVERKKAEILALEAAATAAAAAEEAARNARLRSHQASMLGFALIDPAASNDLKGLQRRVLESFSAEDRARYEVLPPDHVRTPRKPKSNGEAVPTADPAKPVSAAA